MRKAFRGRIRWLSLIVFLLAALLVTRLYFLQVVHGQEYALRAEKQYVSASQTIYDRGTIYFTRKDGTLISAAALQTGFTLAMTPARVLDAERAYARISNHLTVDRDTFMAAAALKDDPYEVIAKKVPDAVGRTIQELEIPGIILERERWRAYPAGPHAAQSLGFVAYNDDHTLAGRYGLERYYNDVLDHRSEGLFGNFFAELFANLDSIVVDARSAREGDVVTSIEPVVQEKLDQVLSDVSARYGSSETGGIIMDPKTGEIIALAVHPTFDPNAFGTSDPERFGNPLVEHTYEFGSIVKPLTIAAGIDAGVITPTATYNDTGCVSVDKHTFCNHDLKARGVVSMQEVLSQSLNVGTAFIAGQLGRERMRSYFTNLGFGTETGIDLPSEVRGNIRNIENSPRQIEYATASFGQGIAMTPVEMIRALATLANDGELVTPHLARSIRLESGITKELNWGPKQQVFKPESVDQATAMLITVVDEALAGGTVKIPEMSVAAKTGTAQIASPDGGYSQTRFMHSIFGYFPAHEPRYIMLLYTRDPGGVRYASETLTNPMMDLTHFLINYYSVPPDRAEFRTR